MSQARLLLVVYCLNAAPAVSRAPSKFAWLHCLALDEMEEETYEKNLKRVNIKDKEKEEKLETLRKTGQSISKKEKEIHLRYKLTPAEKTAKTIHEINHYSKEVPENEKQSWVVTSTFGETLLGLLNHEYEEQERTQTSKHHFSFFSKNCGILLNMMLNRALNVGYTFQLCQEPGEFENIRMTHSVIYLQLQEKRLAYKLLLREKEALIQGSIPAEAINHLLPRKLTFTDLKQHFTHEIIDECFAVILKIATTNEVLDFSRAEDRENAVLPFKKFC